MSSASSTLVRLKKEILACQGIEPSLQNPALNDLLGPILNSFPENSFPIGAVHEFIHDGEEGTAATNGFITALLQTLIPQSGIAVWIGNITSVFPPALKSFGIAPDKILFFDCLKEKEKQWVMEEALRYKGLSAVIAHIQELDFTTSRRFQLAVEKSRVTGFIFRQNPRKINTTACMTRWKISSVPSKTINNLPGLGFPRWQVELLKVRNGLPGKWLLEYKNGKFIQVHEKVSAPLQIRKTG